MRTWRRLMPPDMLLRSDWDHTNLSAPGQAGTLEAWVQSGEAERLEPLPLHHFLSYADWFQRSSCPRATPATLAGIELADGGVRVTTSAGDEVQARAAVLALGVTPFPRVPRHSPRSDDPRVRIVLERSGYDDLAGKRVAVIGAGNNGVESALLALRAEAASVELIVRSRVRWFAEREPHTPRGRAAPAALPDRPIRSSASGHRRSTASHCIPTRSRCCRTRCARASTRACCARAQRPGCAGTSTA